MDIKSSVDSEIFHLHTDLSPLLWDENGDVRPELMPKLMALAQAYVEFCKIPDDVKVQDITLTGSLSGFNYTKYSDLDIHVIIDYNDIPASEELVMNYFMMKKDMWADEFDLKFFTYPIEMYVQDVNQYRAGTSPQYSLMNQQWVHEPVKPEDDFDETTVVKKSKDIMRQVTELEDEVYNDTDFDAEDALEELAELKDKIKVMRVAAIKKSGDFGTGNLVFKVLRNSGFLQRITDLKKYITEKNLSIQNQNMKTLVIKESQYKQLNEMLQAHQNFLNEMEELGGQLMEGTMMEEGLVDNLSGKFRDLLQKSGVNGLRHAVSAAVVAGSLAGVSSDAIAQAAMKAGVSEPQAKEISVQATQKGGGGQQAQAKDFSKDLNMLTKRYVVADNDPQQTKRFMNFTGNLADVVGIEPKYGYPIFTKGSESQKALDAAFTNPQITKGIVNVRGQDLPGQFVQSQGLWYTIGNVNPPTIKDTPVPVNQGNVGRETDPSKLVDYSGTIKQAYLAWQQATKAGQTQDEAPEYIAKFFRERIKGFESMSNSQIAGLFKNGTKIAVNKIGNSATSDIGNMNR